MQFLQTLSRRWSSLSNIQRFWLETPLQIVSVPIILVLLIIVGITISIIETGRGILYMITGDIKFVGRGKNY